ncbi:MAG: hypothetical protein ABI597_13800 [Gammaproteobacteria bacterium]
MLRKLITVFVVFLATLVTSVGMAKSISLYDQPKADAKVTGSIDPALGLVPIFRPKDGNWIKVGDPANGNVGWIKSADLGKAGAVSTGFSFSQSISGNGQEPYVVQFSLPKPLTPEQSKALQKNIQAQQDAIQKGVHQMLQNFYQSLNAGLTNYPVVVPVVIMPQQPNAIVPAAKAPVKK